MQVIFATNMLGEVDEASPDDDPNIKSKHITINVNDICPRYHDISPLGIGANALVFSALDQQCHRRVAVKKVR